LAPVDRQQTRACSTGPRALNIPPLRRVFQFFEISHMPPRVRTCQPTSRRKDPCGCASADLCRDCHYESHFRATNTLSADRVSEFTTPLKISQARTWMSSRFVHSPAHSCLLRGATREVFFDPIPPLLNLFHQLPPRHPNRYDRSGWSTLGLNGAPPHSRAGCWRSPHRSRHHRPARPDGAAAFYAAS